MGTDIEGPEIPSPSEATDGAELGEEVGDETLPGTVGFPPTRSAGLGPAGTLGDPEHQDSVSERSTREQPEGMPPSRDPVVLIDDYPAGRVDDESQLVGEAAPAVGLPGPEELALHIESEADADKTESEADADKTESEADADKTEDGDW